jgi:hypothetical protein
MVATDSARMIPVEVTQTPWHYTTFWDGVDHWQTIIAGGLALAAGILTVVVTMIIARCQIAASRAEADRVIAATREQTETTVRLERERLSGEVNALRKSLANELRLQIPRALMVADSLRRLSSKSDEPITARMVESLSRMPAPIIFSANAGKIGLLDDDAMGVLILYTLLEGGLDGVARLKTSSTSDHLGPDLVLSIADAFLTACLYGRDLLPRLPTGVASHDAKDEALTQQVNAALAARGWA